MNKKRILSFFTLTLALPLLLLATPKAQAYDLKQWSGSVCQAFFGAQEQYFDKTWSGIKNTSTVPRWISCGVVDDSFGFGGGNYDRGTEGAFLYVTQSAGSTTVCYMSERGLVGQEIDTTTTSQAGAGLINVNTVESVGAGGNRLLACKLAAGAILNFIRIWEYDSTDVDH